jgi:hypothetical protein
MDSSGDPGPGKPRLKLEWSMIPNGADKETPYE